MKLKKGEEVFNAEGEKIGTLERVVIDPQTRAVTHIVVEKGWLFSTNKVISMSEIDTEREDKLVVTSRREDPDEFPAFEESHYVNLDQNDQPHTDVGSVFWYPPANLAWWRAGAAYMGYYPPIPNYAVRTTHNIPEGMIALEEGAKVISKDEQHVGNIEQVIVDPEDNRATHFVIQGGLFSKRKLLPVLWISHIDEKEIHLSVNSVLLERLPEYQAEAR